MKLWNSMRTLSYWKYAFLSMDTLKIFFSVLGILMLTVEAIEYFKFFSFQLNDYGLPFLTAPLAVVIWKRRPLSKICYQLPGRDVRIEIRIDDILNIKHSDIVIGTNTTFDTGISEGIIENASLQGKFTKQFYNNDIEHLDRDLEKALKDTSAQNIQRNWGKNLRYPIGTVAKIAVKDQIFYLLAMAKLNNHGVSQSNLNSIKLSLKKLWEFIGSHGELREIAIPLIGTGHGRLTQTREEIIKLIVESFNEASKLKRFSKKLIIVIHFNDYRYHNLNLLELNKYLSYVHKLEKP